MPSWTDPDRASISRRLAQRARTVRVSDAVATAALLVALHVSGLSRSASDSAIAITDSVGLPRVTPGMPAPLMSLASLSISVQTASLFLALALAGAIVSMPFTYVGGFRLARSVGLGTQSTGAWVSDYAVASVLGAALVAILAGLVGWVSADAPHLWWVAATILGTIGTVVLTHLAPVLILPLFYRVKPLPDGPVRARLLDLTMLARTTVRGCDVIDQSRRSLTANAGVIGIGRTRRIMVTDTLLEGGYSTAEIASILARDDRVAPGMARAVDRTGRRGRPRRDPRHGPHVRGGFCAYDAPACRAFTLARISCRFLWRAFDTGSGGVGPHPRAAWVAEHGRGRPSAVDRMGHLHPPVHRPADCFGTRHWPGGTTIHARGLIPGHGNGTGVQSRPLVTVLNAKRVDWGVRRTALANPERA
ncbi:MAG: hypothetical protein EBT22_09425 [Chloroflexi bacterium]|nr:hypothetical protein [Chloroflexota bacterium]